MERYCQSCGMPLGETDELLGTNVDGTKNEEFCKYCYQNGAYTSAISMEEMIEINVKHMATPEFGMSEEEARKMCTDFMPHLKRWKTK